MTTHASSAERRPHTRGAPAPPWWVRWSPPLTLAWSAGTAVIALTWAAGLLPTPSRDPGAIVMGDTLSAFDPMVRTTLTLVVGILGVGWAVVAPRLDGGPGRWAAFVVACLVAGTTGLVMLSGHLLPMLGYTPVTLALGWFIAGLWPAYLDALATPETLFQGHVLIGTLIWGAVLLSYRRLAHDSCAACGRPVGWTPAREERTRHRALVTGRTAVAVAVTCALVYPAVRLPWLFGIPAGMDRATWATMGEDTVAVGVGLGSAALTGAVLMLGLVANWGVRFPWWTPGLAGRRVPVALAVLPASVVALVFVAVSRGFLTAAVAGQLATPIGTAWAHVAALLALLPCGAALLVAVAAYAVRRRGACDRCARGLPESLPR
ncbi:hypothetical protein [Halostreptopolyspora alba]|uniref:Uncharacterized protein n=1 Tax=Halostreptopolyspora alba TaxID=2487137 RepID=A0A3N0DYB0_9ACTN|nr:hypothetical protein EFW17_22900 [Nocardiopsaceae bacterium YIM 96095]